MNDYDYIHQASNERLAEMLEGKAKGIGVLIDHMEFFKTSDELKNLYEEKELYKEAASRLRIPPYRTFHEEYFGEV